MLKVSDLLTLEELPGITLVAGHKNQDQPILKVNILENPDILDWLTAGGLNFRKRHTLRHYFWFKTIL